MTRDNFKETISKYLIEAGEPAPPDPSAAPVQGQPMPDPGMASAPDPAAAGGGTGDLGDLGGLGGLGGGDMGGGMGGGEAGGQVQNQDLCSKKYIALVSYLCELYNANVSNKRNMVLNLKVKVGKTTTLNDVHNSDEVFHFMVHNFLNEDVIDDVKKSIKDADKQLKEIRKSPEYDNFTKHNSTSSFLVDVVTLAYLAICNNAIDDELPEINYGINRDFRVDPKNAKAVFDEIKTNLDKAQKISEVDEQ